MSDHQVLNAVNLTSSPQPQGHGLDRAGHVVTTEEAERYAQAGFEIPAGTVFTDKRAVRIAVKIPSTDRKLQRWLPWAKKRLNPEYLARLVAAGGGGIRTAKTWWLYWGIIPPMWFVSVDLLKKD